MTPFSTTSAIRRAELRSNRHHQHNNIQLFTGRMPFLLPNQQCQSTQGKSRILQNSSPQAHPGFFHPISFHSSILHSRLPWGRVAKPLFSPLTPVPQVMHLVTLSIFHRKLVYIIIESSHSQGAHIQPMCQQSYQHECHWVTFVYYSVNLSATATQCENTYST